MTPSRFRALTSHFRGKWSSSLKDGYLTFPLIFPFCSHFAQHINKLRTWTRAYRINKPIPRDVLQTSNMITGTILVLEKSDYTCWFVTFALGRIVFLQMSGHKLTMTGTYRQVMTDVQQLLYFSLEKYQTISKNTFLRKGKLRSNWKVA